MSILKYCTSNKTSTSKEDDTIFFSLESSGVSSKEYESIVETIKPAEKVKRITYKEEGKMKITKYTNLYSIANAVRQYSKEFANFRERTVYGSLKATRNSYFCVTSKNHRLIFGLLKRLKTTVAKK